VARVDADEAEGLDGTARDEGGGDGRELHVAWHAGGFVAPLPDGRTILIGRGEECDIVVPMQSTSRRHALVTGGATPTIEDLGSANGTLVGGRLLRAGERAILGRGAVARVGGAIVVVEGPRHACEDRRDRGDWVVGERLAAVLALAARYASGTLSVLITGETGVGKERIAAYVHERSARASKSLLRINCAALPEALLESELFGHERGAFTGATAAKRGLLEAAEGGTVFLDEIGEMPLLLQAKLLRAVEAQEIFRVGALRPIPIDVRFVAATNRDLESLAAVGQFRSDLFYRLGGAILSVPPLRERRSEIVPLAEAFLVRARAARGHGPDAFSPDAVEALLTHGWPGNVRELRNVIERAVLLCDEESISLGHLPFTPAPTATPRAEARDREESAPVGSSLRSNVQAEELRQIREALAVAGGNQTRAALLLGISRQTLLRRLDKYSLARPRK
jgi:two-component system response regulator AtoC